MRFSRKAANTSYFQAPYLLQANELSIDASAWESGVYFLTMENEGLKQTFRVVKE